MTEKKSQRAFIYSALENSPKEVLTHFHDARPDPIHLQLILKFRKYNILFLVTLILTLLSGCQYMTAIEQARVEEETAILPAKSYEDNTRQVSNTNRLGAGLTLAMRPPKTLNPLVNEDITVDAVLKLMFEPLFTLGEDGSSVPYLASGFGFNPEGDTATIFLNDNIFFSDGIQLTAADVVFSFETIKEYEETSLYGGMVSQISHMQVVDNSTLTVVFDRPQGGMLFSLCFPVIPRHYYTERTDVGSITDYEPVGSGPYILSHIKPVSEMELSVNEFYHGEAAHINNVNVIVTDSHETDMQAFDQGLIDAVDSDMLSFGFYSGANDIETIPYNTNEYNFLGFNFDNILFEDNRLREAIASCLDRERIKESVYLDHALLADSPVNPESFMAAEDPVRYPYDLNHASDLLFQAGYRDNDLDGKLDREIGGVALNLTFRLLVNQENPQKLKIASDLKENMEALGLYLTVDSCNYETYVQKLEQGEFDMFLGTANFGNKPDFRFLFHSESIAYGQNYFNYQSDELNGYIAEAEAAANETEYLYASAK
ncbi:MAG: peptide ABC transporter substrate-binding protein, partial [Clostridiales bacterium]|nr:peptide ABC transporter substrate-binding protein [Clostridiales bacterium]